MARARAKYNLFGFSKKTTYSSKLLKDAYDAGRRTGDTSKASGWIASRDGQLSSSFKSRLRQRYHDGVHSLWKEEKRQKKENAQEIKEDVIEALASQGMSRTMAKNMVKRYHRSGDSFNALFGRILHRPGYGESHNPAKFDRCVKEVRKSLKKSRRPGNAYAICTASGARNPKDSDSVTDLVPGSSFVVDTLARTGAAWAKVGKRIGQSVKGGVKKLTGKKRKNPPDPVEQHYKDFHGHAPTKITYVTEKEFHHSRVAGQAQLIALNVVATNGQELAPIIAPGFIYNRSLRELWLSHKGVAKGDWETDPRTPTKDIVWLTSSPNVVKGGSTQLFFTGGDQSLDVKALGFKERDIKDSMLIGTIHRIWYLAKKSFEGPEYHAFYHDYGGEGSRGELPVLIYHPRNPSLEMAGGRYKIADVDKSLKASPGIIG